MRIAEIIYPALMMHKIWNGKRRLTREARIDPPIQLLNLLSAFTVDEINFSFILCRQITNYSKACNPYRPNSTWLVASRRVRRVEPMHFAHVELVKQHGSIHSTRRARLA